MTTSSVQTAANGSTAAEATNLHPATQLGAVHLTVSNLDRSLSFYQDVLGFKVQERAGDMAQLGAGRTPFVVLTEVPGARHVANRSGLYHFAV